MGLSVSFVENHRVVYSACTDKTEDSSVCLLMTKGSVSSILKSIKMNNYTTSGDGEARSRYSSVYSGIQARQHPADHERYGRSRTVDSSGRSYTDRYNGRTRYDRSQSRDMGRRYRNSGSVDRQEYFRSRYGGATEDRYYEVAPRDDYQRQGRYVYENRYVDDRYGFDNSGYGYFARPTAAYERPTAAYDRPRYGYEYQVYEQRPTAVYAAPPRRYNPSVYDSRYGVDRSHFEDRVHHDMQQGMRAVRFDRRRSSSIGREEMPRKESVRSEHLRRTRSLPPRQSEEAYYIRSRPSKDDINDGKEHESNERKFSRASSTKEVFEPARRHEEEARRESQMTRRESERAQEPRQSSSRRESEREQRIEFSDDVVKSSSRRESESREQLSRRESEVRDYDRREFEEDLENGNYRRESEGRPLSSSRRESEARQLTLSRRESERQDQLSVSRRESERQEQLSRRESEHQEQLSRRESERQEHFSLSRRESEKQDQLSLSRRESEGYQLSGSRRESEGRQLLSPSRESDGCQLSVSRRESEGRQLSHSRRESEGRQLSTSRRESEGRQLSTSRRESEGHSPARQQSLSRRESESRDRASSRRESQERVRSRTDSEQEQRRDSRRESESQRRDSRRESESQGPSSSSRRESRDQEASSSRRDSEALDDEVMERPLSRQGSSSRAESLHERKDSGEDLSDEEAQDIKLSVPVVARSRSQSRSRQGSDGELEPALRRESSERRVRRTVQFGSQFGGDRIPAPIPPYSEPRSNYPTSKDHTHKEDERTAVRSRELAVRATYDVMRRRYYEKSVDPSLNPTWLQRGGTTESSYNTAQVSDEVLRVEEVDFRCRENAKRHNTFDYEIVRDVEQPNPVYRRGATFVMDVTFREREFEASRDNVFLNFYFGPNPSVPKLTRVVLPIREDEEFQRAPYQWDAKLLAHDRRTLTVEVHIPASSPVGMWRCVVETSTREDSSARLQFRCPEDLYVLFNPFSKDDGVFMADEARRDEFVQNPSGKIYTGGYRNVRGRPWVYGQFDDCVLSAACVLLELSGLAHAERGNPVKVAKALTSMIRASRGAGGSEDRPVGLLEARYDDDYRGGNSPHLWTGSVQIIEEFLRLGAAPVKYGQCWVMTGLMTTLCRALGLPARPVTAFVSAVDAQDTLTVDRFIDRYGDIQEQQHGTSSGGQKDCVWSFRTWCEVWMQRPDLLAEYSGWQATDPCQSFLDDRNVIKGACGPCPVEALRRGDIGQRDDVDAFFSSMNAYVRYFYEDEESGWGYSPFRQFKHPISRYVITKSVGRLDDDGDDDCENLTSSYRDEDFTDEERFKTFNSCRGLKDCPSFEYQAAAHNWMEFDPNEVDDRNFDVEFSLEAPERVMVGQAFI